MAEEKTEPQPIRGLLRSSDHDIRFPVALVSRLDVVWRQTNVGESGDWWLQMHTGTRAYFVRLDLAGEGNEAWPTWLTPTLCRAAHEVSELPGGGYQLQARPLACRMDSPIGREATIYVGGDPWRLMCALIEFAVEHILAQSEPRSFQLRYEGEGWTADTPRKRTPPGIRLEVR